MSCRVKTLATATPPPRARRGTEPEASLRAYTANMSRGGAVAGIRSREKRSGRTVGQDRARARSLLAGKGRRRAQLSLSATFMSLTS